MVPSATYSTPKPIDVWLIDDNEEYGLVVSEALNVPDTMHCSRRWTRCEPPLNALDHGSTPPQVLLLDIGLPGMGGLSAIEVFKQRSPTMKVIMLTVFDMDEKVVAALRNGASGYVLKSSGMAEIVRAVESAMHGGLPLDPMVTRNLLHAVQPPAKRSTNDYGLTDRERQVLRFLVEGYSFQDIANRMFISISTVNWHVQNINEKLNVHSRSLAVAKALKEGLI